MNRKCSVRDKCGPTGKECRSDDRECQSAAVQDGLEIVCDEDGLYVYCPAGTQQRDSTIVWVLLGVAVLIAIAGGVLFARVMKKPVK